jgi:hypothetical protein
MKYLWVRVKADELCYCHTGVPSLLTTRFGPKNPKFGVGQRLSFVKTKRRSIIISTSLKANLTTQISPS